MCATPLLHPGESWTPATAAAFVARHDADVSAEVVRVKEEMADAFPHGTVSVHRYDAAGLLRWYPTRAGLDAQPLAHVQVRVTSGAIQSAVVSVHWETGDVVVRGWPLDAASGWRVPG